MIAGQCSAQELLKDLWATYFSNADHVESPTQSPQYFIKWAKLKCIEISWLDWAKTRGYVDGSMQTTSSDQVDLDKRERDTLDTLVGALLNALKINPSGHGVIKKIVGITEDYDAPIRKTAISKILKRIPTATESVQDRKSR